MAHETGVLLSRASPKVAACLIALAATGPAAAPAQSLPEFAPLNPVAASRTGLYFQPYRPARPGRWTTSFRLDYGSAIEYNVPSPRPSYLLDGEFLRFQVALARDLGPRTFVQGLLSLNGAYAGFLDGFLKWYHRLFGFSMPERDARPNGSFAYQLALANGVTLDHSPSSLYLGDLRLGIGHRYDPHLQSVFSVTLPTSTRPDGYGLGTLALGLVNTVHAPVSSRLMFEGGLGIGFTPTHGELSAYQHRLLATGSAGFRLRFWGRQSLYANFFYHSPYYHDTTLHALDRKDLDLDFGWMLATRGGSEWRVGLTEDLQPSGPAIDLVFRFGGGF